MVLILTDNQEHYQEIQGNLLLIPVGAVVAVMIKPVLTLFGGRSGIKMEDEHRIVIFTGEIAAHIE